MRPSLYLRIAAVAAGVQGLAHGLLVWRYVPHHGAAEIAVIDAMRTHHFTFAGVSRSYWDFYFGYAMANAFLCLVEAILFWQLARLARVDARMIGPVAAAFVLFNVGHAAIASQFFIPTPIVFDLLLVVLLGASISPMASLSRTATDPV